MFYFKRLTRIFMRLVYSRSKYSMFKDTSTQFTCLADNSVLLSVMLSLGMTDLWTTGFTKKKIDVTGKIVQNVVKFVLSIDLVRNCQALCPLSTLFSVYINLMFHSSLCQISFYESYSGHRLTL